MFCRPSPALEFKWRQKEEWDKAIERSWKRTPVAAAITITYDNESTPAHSLIKFLQFKRYPNIYRKYIRIPKVIHAHITKHSRVFPHSHLDSVGFIHFRTKCFHCCVRFVSFVLSLSFKSSGVGYFTSYTHTYSHPSVVHCAMRHLFSIHTRDCGVCVCAFLLNE